MPKTEPTPLEQLTEMNQRVGKTRKRSARPRDPTDRIETFYAAQLRSLVAAMSAAVNEHIKPVVKEIKSDYTPDAIPYTADSWTDRLQDALRAAMALFVGLPASGMESQYRRTAQRVVSMAESETTSAFVDGVNRAVGVDLSPVLDEEGMADYIDVAVQDNVELIRTIPEQHFRRIEQAVYGGVRAGQAPTQIALNIQQATGITQRRARGIARDQASKLRGEITERRQQQAGVKYFRWATSKDERVGTDHARAASRDVGYGPGVYRWDRPPKEGIPGRAARPNCRCTATPIFEWELPTNKR